MTIRAMYWAVLVMIGIATQANAQYLRMTTDNPTDNTRLRLSGTTIVTITLDTNHDRNGTLQTCNSHTSANCGAPTTGQNLDMFSYTIALKAVGGTVTWGTFSAADAAYTDTSPQIQNDTEVEINKSRPTGTFSTPGPNVLGTIPVTPVSGAPGIQPQIGAGALNPFGFGNGFGTSCDAFTAGNTYLLGDPTDPCGDVVGFAGDWFDWDGVSSGTASNNPPLMNAPATATASEGSAFSITAQATDPDAGDILTISVSGQPPVIPYLPVSGPSPLSATLTGTPGFNDSGIYQIHWTATDQAGLTDVAITSLTVANTNRAPVLNTVANMTVPDGSTRDQAISASDPDGDPLMFSKVSGPTFMTVTTTTATTGNIHLAVGFSDDGTYSATVRVSDGTLSVSNSFSIIVGVANRAPTLNPISNMNVNVGGCGPASADQAISGSDPDGDPLTFSKVSGPTYMTVTTTSPTTGNIHLAPSPSDVGGNATARASDGFLTSDRSFFITVAIVNQSPTLNQPANMTVNEGATANQTLFATAPCSTPLTFSKLSGPSFVTVTTTNPGTGTATGNLHLAPSVGDQGTYSVTIAVSDGSLNNQKSLMITVSPTTDHPPVLNQPSNMSVGGCGPASADQAISGSDPDGDPLTFSKVAGPTYMTVTTTSPTTGNIHLAPSPTEPTGTSTGTVRASDGTLSADRSFTITHTGTNCPPVLDPINNMFVAEGSTQDQTITGHDPNGNALQFTKVSGPTFMTVTTTNPGIGTATGNIHLAPGFTDAGAYSATVQLSDGSLSTQGAFSISVCNACGRPPVLDPIADMTVVEGNTMDQTVTGSDPDGDALTFFKSSGPIFMTVSTINTTSGNVHLAPGFADAGTYSAVVSASDGSLTSARGFAITALTSGNRCPTANPGSAHYAGIVGVPLGFNGTLSSDPDGNPLSYAWDFDASNGITVDATGALVSHVYPINGSYTVTLTVTDNGDGDPAQICSNSATTTADITSTCDATVFNGYDTIRLGAGKPFWFAYVQPVSISCFTNTDVVVSSFVMVYAGRQISASGKTSVGGDKNGDGIAEVKVSFSKDDLRVLFSGTGLGNGHNTVTVTLTAMLTTGGRVSGTTQLDVVNNGNFTAAIVSPNPLNPEATLTYTTTRTGAVRVDLFDIQGRLIRRLVDEPSQAAGTHEATIDGRGTHGEKLPSGVYYVRGVSQEGTFTKLITILK